MDQSKTYVVLRDTVLPRESGGTITLRAGAKLVDTYYERFVETGIFRVELSAGTSRLSDEKEETTIPKEEDSVAPIVSVRDELEGKTKKELQSIAGVGVKGTKAELIKHILKG